MGAIKILHYIRLYGIPDFLLFYTSYSVIHETRSMDEGLKASLQIFTLIVGACYMISRVRQIEINNRMKILELRLKEEELLAAELDNKLKSLDIEKKELPKE